MASPAKRAARITRQSGVEPTNFPGYVNRNDADRERHEAAAQEATKQAEENERIRATGPRAPTRQPVADRMRRRTELEREAEKWVRDEMRKG